MPYDKNTMYNIVIILQPNIVKQFTFVHAGHENITMDVATNVNSV